MFLEPDDKGSNLDVQIHTRPNRLKNSILYFAAPNEYLLSSEDLSNRTYKSLPASSKLCELTTQALSEAF